MGKYIVETDETTAARIQGCLGLPIEICGKRTWVKTNMELMPYTEPDLEQVRKEAYDKGYTDAAYNCHERCAFLDDAKKEEYQRGYETAKHECEDCPKQAYTDALRMESYQKGLKDAWEAARKIVLDEWDNCIEYDDFYELFNGKSCKEVLKTYTASECIEKIRKYEQKNDRHARIEYNFDEIKDVINTTMKECNVSLDEIAEVLQKMRETT